MRHFKEGDTLVIEPFRARSFPVIRDLMVDRGAFDASSNRRCYRLDAGRIGMNNNSQIRLPVVGPLLLNSHSPRRLASGPWTWKSLQGYTSPGAGSSMVPVRFNCPPEIGLIELKSLRP